MIGATVRVVARARRRVQLDFGEPVIDRYACGNGGRRKRHYDWFVNVRRHFRFGGVQVLDATDLLWIRVFGQVAYDAGYVVVLDDLEPRIVCDLGRGRLGIEDGVIDIAVGLGVHHRRQVGRDVGVDVTRRLRHVERPVRRCGEREHVAYL